MEFIRGLATFIVVVGAVLFIVYYGTALVLLWHFSH